MRRLREGGEVREGERRGGEEIDASGEGGCLHLFGGIIGPEMC